MSAEPPRLVFSTARPDDASHQASAWFALMQGGSLTEAEREELAQWLTADPRHAQAFAHLEKVWAASALLMPPSPRVGQPQILSRRRFVGLGLAACTAAVATSASTLWLKGVGSPFADLRTAVGERLTRHLPDGSIVELAGDTALNIDFSSSQRTVELLRGEAFFNVASDPSRVFTLQTDAGRIMTTEGEFCVSCEDATATLAVSKQTVRVITPNQQADISDGLSLRFSTTGMEPIQRAEMEQILAWRTGRLVFFDTPLISVVNELQRWREGKIFIPDKQLAARRVSLILNLNRPDQMLDVLSKALAVRMTRYTDLVTLIHTA